LRCVNTIAIMTFDSACSRWFTSSTEL